MKEKDKITVKGARTHNLKNITVEMPRNKMIVFTGLSGSGNHHWRLILFLLKASGGMLNLFRHMQGNFCDKCRSLMWMKSSVFRLQFLLIKNLVQTTRVRTVATITEIYDYLRILVCSQSANRIVWCADVKSKSFLRKKL